MSRAAFWKDALPNVLMPGVAVGMVGFMGFLAVHAIVIVPIWSRSLGGLPFALVGGIALAAAFDRAAENLRTIPRIAAFGAGTWIALWPATLLGVWLRAAGLRPKLGDWELTLEIAVALSVGALAGWQTCKTKAGAVAFAVALTALLLAMAGPIPILTTRRALRLFLAFLPIYLLAAFVLAAARRAIDRLKPPSENRDSVRP
jgi:hypothetical protein